MFRKFHTFYPIEIHIMSRSYLVFFLFLITLLHLFLQHKGLLPLRIIASFSSLSNIERIFSLLSVLLLTELIKCHFCGSLFFLWSIFSNLLFSIWLLVLDVFGLSWGISGLF